MIASETRVQSGACKHGRPWYNVRVADSEGRSWWLWGVDEKSPCPECEAEAKAKARQAAEDVAWHIGHARWG